MTTFNADDRLCAGRILVVDDEPHVRELICRSLRDSGYSCAAAADASAALQHLAKHEIDLVTLDIRMPGRSGSELLHELNAKYPDIAIIMLTGYCDSAVAIDALTYGASAYLTKPVDFSELVFHVSRGIQRRNLILENRRYTESLEEMVARKTASICKAHEETVVRLMSASAHRDEETGAHIQRVGQCSEILARALGWPPVKADVIRMAATMHDVGKIGIPDVILRKPGKLTVNEFQVMKTHTTIGASLLAGSDSPVLRLAEQIAHSHHERWDGTGYPGGVSGTAIPTAARIVSVVDVYDALTHDRVYRPALPEEQAVANMVAGRGSQFDPEVLDVFLEILPEIRRIRWNNPDEGIATPLVAIADIASHLSLA